MNWSYDMITYYKTHKDIIMANELESYLGQVRTRQARLDLSIFQEGQERDFSSVSLDQFYVPLRIAGRPPTLADEQPERIEAERADLRSDQLLDPANKLGLHLALLGDAGSGKTTILRHLSGALAQAGLNQDLDFARQQTGLTDSLLTPIFIPVRHYHHYCQQTRPRQSISWGSFLEFLPHYFQKNYNLSLTIDFYQQLLNSGRCLLALDGFDELPDSDTRRQVINLVRDIAADATLGCNNIILSSRRAAYGGPNQLGGTFQTLWVQNLNAAERTQQIQRWVAGISPYTDSQLKADDILDRLTPANPLHQLAVTPMIVTTLCVVYFYDHELPEQRAQLYRRCVDIMLYERLRPDEPGQTLADLAGKPDFKRQLLARLAFAMHQAGKDEVNKEQAARWLKDGFKSVDEADRLHLSGNHYQPRHPAARADSPVWLWSTAPDLS